MKISYLESTKLGSKETITMEDIEGGIETILVAEDDTEMRQLITDILESGGYVVIGTENGESAVETYASRKYKIDLVILDMVMPKMGGSDAFRKLKEIDPDVQVLLSSGYTQNERGGLDAGVAGFLAKPYRILELLETVRMVLKKGRKS